MIMCDSRIVGDSNDKWGNVPKLTKSTVKNNDFDFYAEVKRLAKGDNATTDSSYAELLEHLDEILANLKDTDFRKSSNKEPSQTIGIYKPAEQYYLIPDGKGGFQRIKNPNYKEQMIEGRPFYLPADPDEAKNIPFIFYRGKPGE